MAKTINYKNRLMIRDVNAELHKNLKRIALEKGVSLNTLTLAYLQRCVNTEIKENY
jgi:predicted HicB family RNase H-like nuclease